MYDCNLGTTEHMCTNEPYHSSSSFCNNCGKRGHLFHQCRMPIMSNGIIAFRYNWDETQQKNVIEYLMIRRKDTLGYLDFLRGKYSLYQKSYIMNMLKQMTSHEKQILREKADHIKAQYYGHRANHKDKMTSLILGINHDGEYYDLKSLLEESDAKYQVWDEPEWGFPKGRRNPNESDYDCATREFGEETGYLKEYLHDLVNMIPVQEVFTGSNYYSYKHKYYIMYMDPQHKDFTNRFQSSEVSGMEWKTIEQCLESIRPYNLEKRKMIQHVHECLTVISLVRI